MLKTMIIFLLFALSATAQWAVTEYYLSSSTCGTTYPDLLIAGPFPCNASSCVVNGTSQSYKYVCQSGAFQPPTSDYVVNLFSSNTNCDNPTYAYAIASGECVLISEVYYSGTCSGSVASLRTCLDSACSNCATTTYGGCLSGGQALYCGSIQPSPTTPPTTGYKSYNYYDTTDGCGSSPSIIIAHSTTDCTQGLCTGNYSSGVGRSSQFVCTSTFTIPSGDYALSSTSTPGACTSPTDIQAVIADGDCHSDGSNSYKGTCSATAVSFSICTDSKCENCEVLTTMGCDTTTGVNLYCSQYTSAPTPSAPSSTPSSSPSSTHSGANVLEYSRNFVLIFLLVALLGQQ